MVARALPAAHELGEELLWGDVVVSEQNDAVIPEVAHLVEDLLAHVVLRGDDRLDSLLADLLEDFVLALVKQVVRVGTLDRVEAAVLDDVVEIVEDSGEVRLLRRRHDGDALLLPAHELAAAEAGVRARMAGDTRLMHAHEQCVAVAVVGDFLDLLNVAGRLALLPELLAAAAKEPGVARLQRLLEGFLVHVGQHEHLAVLLLHDSRHEALLVKLDHRNVNRIFCICH